MCPECSKNDIDSEMTFEDDSFSHHFGVEIIQYYYCEKCEHIIDAGEVTPEWED